MKLKEISDLAWKRSIEEKYTVKTFDTVPKALHEKPDATIISTPLHLHAEHALLAAKQKIPFFTEVNIIKDGLEKAAVISKKIKQVA